MFLYIIEKNDYWQKVIISSVIHLYYSGGEALILTSLWEAHEILWYQLLPGNILLSTCIVATEKRPPKVIDL